VVHIALTVGQMPELIFSVPLCLCGGLILLMQLKQALTSAIDRLDAAEVGSPRLNAEVLLMFVLGVNRAYLYAHPERELASEEGARYDEVLAQRATGMPSQYITGHQEFWGLDFVVSSAVLIPRPETEHLVETVLELARELPHPKIVDVGTGSGAIALALAHELKSAEVYAVDLSAGALEIARANAARLQLDGRVEFAQCDVLRPIHTTSGEPSDALGRSSTPAPQTLERSRATSESEQPRSGGSEVGPGRKPRVTHENALSRSGATPSRQPLPEGAASMTLENFDFVVSNPPYVGFDEADKVQKSVREFEPQMAVFAGERGLDIIGPLIDQAHHALKNGGWLAMEIGYSMRDAVVNLLNPTLWDEVRVVPDLQGIPRVIAGRKR
jgi:methylase of polypeptide subunit release factors